MHTNSFCGCVLTHSKHRQTLPTHKSYTPQWAGRQLFLCCWEVKAAGLVQLIVGGFSLCLPCSHSQLPEQMASLGEEGVKDDSKPQQASAELCLTCKPHIESGVGLLLD